MSKLKLIPKSKRFEQYAAYLYNEEQIKREESKIELLVKNRKFINNKLKDVTILHEEITNETFNIKVHKIKEIKKTFPKLTFSDEIMGEMIYCKEPQVDPESIYEFEHSENIIVTSFEEMVKYIDEDKKIYYTKTRCLVFLDGDKLVMGNYQIIKDKRLGKKHFKITHNNKSFSINLKTGCFYSIITNWVANKLEAKVIKKNDFKNIPKKDFKEEALDIFLKYLEEKFDLGNQNNLESTIIEWFLKFHKIKVNNNYIQNFKNFYPGLQNIKKSNFNLVDGIIKKYKLYGKKVKKLLNTNDNVNIFNLTFFNSLFEINIFNNLPDEFMLYFLENCEELTKFKFNQKMNYEIDSITYEEFIKVIKNYLSLGEQNRLLKTLINSLEYNIMDMQLLIDHLYMKLIIEKATGKPQRIQCRTREEFNKEHNLFSKLIKIINDNYISIIKYKPELVNHIEKPIIINHIIYEPILLKDKKEYLDEGIYQHHCVGGYVNRLSHIISIRNGEIRMTCEYSPEGINAQTRMRFNQDPDKDWILVKNELDKRIKNLRNTGLFGKKEVEKFLDKEKIGLLQENINENENLINNYELVEDNVLEVNHF